MNMRLLNLQYQEIKQRCIVKFFCFAGQEGADVFLRINVFCQKLLKRYISLLSLKRQQDRIRNSICLEEDDYVCDFVQLSYSGFWNLGNQNEEDFEKDKFLAHHSHVCLLDWSENINPYDALQKFSLDFIQEKFSMNDIVSVFKSFLIILNDDVSPQETSQSIRNYLEEFFPNEVNDIL